MSDAKNGGPAFPYVATNNANEIALGMTLRDYFAAKAMQATWPRYHGMSAEWSMCAKEAYRMADAMLAARENNHV